MTITVALFGDSITAPVNGENAWPNWLPDDIEIVEGSCHPGFKAAQIAACVEPVVADVHVIMVGTNDVSSPAWQTPYAITRQAVKDIIIKSEATVPLVLAVPPRQWVGAVNMGGYTNLYNADLKAWCLSMGWAWCDPWRYVRKTDGTWDWPGLTGDGVHPTYLGALHVARQIEPVLLQLAGN